MQIGLMCTVGPRRWVDFAVLAEGAGFESVWVPEHLVMPVAMSGKPNAPEDGEPPVLPTTPAFDPWVQLAVMGAVTSTLKLGTLVYNVGLRHPFITARAVTTLDNATSGRVVLGLGASWLRQEWDAVQLPFDGRGPRIDETIDVIRRLFTEDEVAHDGEFFQFPAVGFAPKPVQKPGPPMLIGGDSRAAMRRAAVRGDGWIPMEQTIESLPGNLATIATLRAEAGRSGPFEVALPAHVTSAQDVRRWQDAGATRLIVSLNLRDPDALDRFTQEVLARA